MNTKSIRRLKYRYTPKLTITSPMKITTQSGATIELRDHGTGITITTEGEIRITGPAEYEAVRVDAPLKVVEAADKVLQSFDDASGRPGWRVTGERKKPTRLRPGLPVYVYNLKHANLTSRRDDDPFHAVIVFVRSLDAEGRDRVCTVAGYDHMGTSFRESMEVFDTKITGMMDIHNRPEAYAVVAGSL